MSQRHEQSTRAVRVTAAVAIGAGVVLAFAALGAPGLAQTSSSAAQYQYGKTTLCHHAGPHGKRVTITVGDSAVPAHMRHGDTVGPCPATPGEDRGEKKHAAAKAGAAKAAKAKAEREHGAAKSESGAKAKPAEKTAAKPKAAKSGSEREPRTDHASPEPGKGRPPAKQKDDSAARGGPPAKTAQPAAPQPAPAPAPAPAAGGNEDKGNHGQGNGQGNAGDHGNHGDGSNGKGHGKG